MSVRVQHEVSSTASPGTPSPTGTWMRRRRVTAMATIEESVEVEVPVRTAYNQWTQFEEFPRFMEGVEQVRQLTDTKLHWVAEIAGRRREWDAEITEQVPDQRISWCSTEGATNSGVVTFHRLGEGRSKVMLQLEFERSEERRVGKEGRAGWWRQQ